MEFTESDWKLFRKHIARWQEAYIDKLNKEYIEILSGENEPSEKFWKLAKKINSDKFRPGVKIEMTRSRFIESLICLINDGVIDISELSDFSEDLQNTIKTYIS